MKQQPFFSIIIPTLNEERYLPLLLSDLAAQSFKNFEVIIVDAESSDKTATVCKNFKQQLQLHFMTTQPGVSQQRNSGLRFAKGSWIIFMDADNRINSSFLETALTQIKTQPQIDLFSCWMDVSTYSRADQPLILLVNIGMELAAMIKPMAPGALIFAHKKVVDEVQFDEKISLSEDHEFVLQAIKKGFKFAILREPRFSYSLRRFKHDGTLKTLRACARASLLYLAGEKVQGIASFYPMSGGGYYDTTSYRKHLFGQLQQVLTSAPSSQINQAKKVLASIKNKLGNSNIFEL